MTIGDRQAAGQYDVGLGIRKHSRVRVAAYQEGPGLIMKLSCWKLFAIPT